MSLLVSLVDKGTMGNYCSFFLFTFLYRNNTSQGLEWMCRLPLFGSAIQYLSNFRKEEHKDILYQEDLDFSMNRNATIELANLNDKSSIERIIGISEKERVGHDVNSHSYLIALSRIKNSKAKDYILTFENSYSEYISKLVEEIITVWQIITCPNT